MMDDHLSAASLEIRKAITRPKTNSKSSENRPGPKRKRSYSNHPFSGANLC